MTPVERAALLPQPAPALRMPKTSPFSLVEHESETLEELAPAESSDVPDWMVDTAYTSPAAVEPEGAGTREPAGAQVDPLDELEQYEELAQGGDISQRELDTLKVELAQRTGATSKVTWIPLVLLGGLVAWSLVRPGRVGRRGWGG